MQASVILTLIVFRHLLIEFGLSPLNTSLNVEIAPVPKKSAQKKPLNRGMTIITRIAKFVNTFFNIYIKIFFIINCREVIDLNTAIGYNEKGKNKEVN